jgi:TonB family protein
MVRHARSFLVAAFVLVVLSVSLPANSVCQSLDLLLNKSDKANLDLAASHVAQKIQEAKLAEGQPTVLVMDFYRGSAGTSSLLGSQLADRFSELLSDFSKEFRVLDRNILKNFLAKEWITLESLQSNGVCLRIGHEVGAIAVITGKAFEENGFIALRIHLVGFGPDGKDDDIISDSDENVRLTETQQLRDMLFQRGHDYSRGPYQIPDEPGVLRAGVDGVGTPSCVYCPDPQYSDASRVVKAQGSVILSVIVTSEGKADSIYIIKGAPFGQTSQAIKAVQSWKFRPAQKDGKPVAVRVPIEITFHLF